MRNFHQQTKLIKLLNNFKIASIIFAITVSRAELEQSSSMALCTHTSIIKGHFLLLYCTIYYFFSLEKVIV